MAKRCVFNKGQAYHCLAKQSESGHAVTGWQPVFHKRITLVGEGADQLLVITNIAFCLAEVFPGEFGIFGKEIGVESRRTNFT